MFRWLIARLSLEQFLRVDIDALNDYIDQIPETNESGPRACQRRAA